MANARPSSAIVNRTAERAAIDGLLDAARAGSSDVLVLIGPPGIGKSVLIDYALDVARDMSVYRIAGFASETALAFAGVHQVVAPHLEDLGGLAEPHRRALESALGLAEPQSSTNLYLVGLAVLDLLSRAATTDPLLVAVDDTQWLDEESTKVLSFVARRLHADRVAMLFATWDEPEVASSLAGLHHLNVEGLDNEDACELLTSTAGVALDESVSRMVVRAAEGNPLALLAIATELSPDQLQGITPLPEPLPTGQGLEDLYALRAQRLDVETQTVLLLTAAERQGDPVVVRRAAEELGVTAWEDAVKKAEATGLVAFTSEVRFRHPLARSAVYYSAPESHRCRVHGALAGVLTDPPDADRRARHLGASSVDPDERIARELEAVATRAEIRGGASIAGKYFMRAAELTPDPQRATDRWLKAARAELTGGNAPRAEAILQRVRVADPTPQVAAEVAWVESLCRLVGGQVGDAGALLGEALPHADTGERDAALGMLVAAIAIALQAGHLAAPAQWAQIGPTAERIVTERDLPVVAAQLGQGAATRLAGDYASAAPFWHAAVSTANHGPQALVDAVGRHIHVVYFDSVLAAEDLLDDDAWADLTRSWVELARQTGALAALPLALNASSQLEVLEGRVRTAGSHLAELEAIVPLVGQRGLLGKPTAGAVLLHAWQGEEREARAGARSMMQDAHEREDGRTIDQAQRALVVLELGAGRYQDALRIARRLVDRDGVGTGTPVLADLAEAAVRCGDRELGLEALDQLTERSTASGSAWALGLLARVRGLLADSGEADQHYRDSLEHLSGCRVAAERARTQLLHGEWLRRARRRRDAREPLREALEFFEAMGASLFAARARQELGATGERLRRSEAPVAVLTPQEAQIARHAAAGDRNQEIAAQLFISTSTVEYHLRKIFVKLGVRSRTELAALDLPA